MLEQFDKLTASGFDRDIRLAGSALRRDESKAEELYGLPVDTAIAFCNHKGIYKRKMERRQRNLLKKLVFLAPFLEPDEKILHVTSGWSPITWLDQLLTSTILYSLKRALFVVTNIRILHIPTTHNLSYRGSIAQIPYTDCMQIRIGWSTMTAKYKSGRTEKFHYIRRRDRKKIKTLLKNVSLEGRTSPAFERTHLCPRCTHPLIKDYYICPNCSLGFKSKTRATMLSIIFPGGGYFYTRHPIIGTVAAVTEMLFASMLIFALLAFFLRCPSDPRGLGQAIAVCAIALVFDKLITILYSNKCVAEFIPKQPQVEVLIAEAMSRHYAPKLEEMLCTNWRSR